MLGVRNQIPGVGAGSGQKLPLQVPSQCLNAALKGITWQSAQPICLSKNFDSGRGDLSVFISTNAEPISYLFALTGSTDTQGALAERLEPWLHNNGGKVLHTALH